VVERLWECRLFHEWGYKMGLQFGRVVVSSWVWYWNMSVFICLRGDHWSRLWELLVQHVIAGLLLEYTRL
jgi:hypothetical protein